MLNKFISIVLIPYFLLLFLIEIIFYKFLNKENSVSSHKILLYIFCFFGGRAINIIDIFLKKKISFSNNQPNSFLNYSNFLKNYNNNSLISKFNHEEALKELDDKGYFIIKGALDNKTIDSIKNKLILSKGFYFSDDYNSTSEEELNLDKPKSTTFRYKSENILNIEEIQDIVFDKNLISIVMTYLKCQPILDIVTAWWSFNSKEPDINSAQKWHFDLDRTKWLKIFIFLKDCTLENGAHSYIKGSHKPNGIPFKLRSKLYSRLEDNEIKNIFKKEDIIDVIANKGDILIEDTKGLHKGNRVLRGNRLLVQLQFSSNLFGGKIEKVKFPEVSNQRLENLKINFPSLFSNCL